MSKLSDPIELRNAKFGIGALVSGYDIPAGVNPMVQLHEQEMVLPMAQANAIRDMANGGGGGGSPMHVTIHAIDSQSIKKLLMDNGHHVADALRQQLRNGGSLK